MSDVVKMAKDRRDNLQGKIRHLHAEIDRLSTFIKQAEELADELAPEYSGDKPEANVAPAAQRSAFVERLSAAGGACRA